MAEIVLSVILEALVEKLTSKAVKILIRSYGIHSQLKKWETWLPLIQDVLFDAEQRQVTEKSVQRWLSELEDLAYDIEDVLDDLATEAMQRKLTEESGASTSKVRRLIQAGFTRFFVSPKVNEKLDDITTKLQNLTDQIGALKLVLRVRKSKNRNTRFESTSLLVDEGSIVGRQGDKETLVQRLLGDEQCNQNFSIVPIVGMGGLGKTTLARLLYNDGQVKDHFELKVWVCVSDELDIFKISKTIFQSVTGENKEFQSLDLLQVALKKSLSDKRFLLVLDDAWCENVEAWKCLASPFNVGAPGSKIIITTRNTTVASAASARGSHDSYPLRILSEDDALTLFAQEALGEKSFDSHPTLKPYGEGIVKKCGRLPLALMILGRVLRTKDNEEEWEELLNSEEWKKESEILPALRLSYHDLPAHLKHLFAYCSLFPKDYVFDKENLVLLWMAEGFLHQSTGSNKMESFGCKCFQELLSRSFFQQVPDGESLYMMHDLMNDLATYVAGDFFFRLDNEMDAHVTKEALEKYRRMSFISQTYEVCGKFKVFEKTRRLRTLIAVSVGVKNSWQGFYLSSKILDDLLAQLPLLRVLSLSGYMISEVPESIGNLKHLRYLNLSRTEITYLPDEVGDLYNLQTLLLCGCRSLVKLPRSFLKLKNLRHLDITYTAALKLMPLGIGKLKNLQTLTKVIIGGANGFAITELKDMKDLHGRLSIKGLDKVHNAMDAEEANLLQKRLSELEMEWSHVFDASRKETLENEVLNVLKPRHDNLEKLKIVSYGGTQLPSWVGDPLFLRLAHVTIRNCKKCTSLPPLGQLPLLKELVVEGMDEVKGMGLELLWNGNCCGGIAFPLLEILSFVNMPSLEVWSTNNGDIGKSLSHLRKLRIDHCPNLVEVSLETLPSLRELDISRCGDGVLRSLVRAASSVTKLKISQISGLTQLHGEILKYLGSVEEISIEECDEMRYLWESEAEACKVLVNLRKLSVNGCNNLVRLGEKEEDNCGSSLPSLRDFWIWSCGSLELCNFPNSIEKLKIFYCGSITSVSFPTRGQKKLKWLQIWECEKPLEEESSGEKSRVLLNTSMSLLKHVLINNMSNLKSFPSFSCFIHLTSLQIMNCKNLESVPDEEFSHLTLLTVMAIADCPSMNDSFPRGLWPPNLRFLKIGGLKKAISEWGPQHFPKSLVDLDLWGTATKEVCSSSQLSHLLPSSLTSLRIYDFEKLESLSTGFQHLTSLQHLEIKKCPNLRDLPETLTSLQHLNISSCANLRDLPETLTSLQHLNIDNCPNLRNLPETLTSLQHLSISYCPMITDLPETLLPSLWELNISGCPKLKERCSRRGSYRPLIRCRRRGSYWPLVSHIPSIRIN